MSSASSDYYDSRSESSYSEESSYSDESSFRDESSYSENNTASGQSSNGSGIVDAACVVANSDRPNATIGNATFGTVLAETDEFDNESEEEESGRLNCFMVICIIFLLLGGGVAAAYFLYFKERWFPPGPPETAEPTFAPTNIWYPIPTLEDCNRISNGENVLGQDRWGDATLWDVKLDITLTDFTLTENYELATSDLQQRLQTILAPELAGCFDVEGYEPKSLLRRDRRRLNSARYIVGNVDIHVIEELDEVCASSRISLPNCFAASIQLDLFLKGDQGQNFVSDMIFQSFADFDTLVQKLNLSIAYEKLYVKNINPLSVRATRVPTPRPTFKTPAPSAGPSYSRLSKIEKALSGFESLNEGALQWIIEDTWDPMKDEDDKDYDNYWIDRYSLVTLYFETVGRDWKNNNNWLTPTSVCDGWYGITCDESNAHVTGISLESNMLVSSIPSEVAMMSELVSLNLNSNELNTTFTLELTSMTQLTHLHLGGNHLTGDIPTKLGEMKGLVDLLLNDNDFNSKIPSEIGSLNSLKYLNLENNKFENGIPSELGLCTSLIEINLVKNKLKGTIPTELLMLSELEKLYLTKNKFSGTIRLIKKWKKMTEIFLNDNKLTGSIPKLPPDVAVCSFADNYFDDTSKGEVGNICDVGDQRVWL